MTGRNELRIRPAQPRDLAAAAVLVERAYSVYIPRIGRRPAPMDDDFSEQIRSGQMFVGEAESGEVLGLIVLVDGGDHLLVENVAVDPDHQRRGFGRALLSFAERRAESAGLPELRLYTNVAMTENVLFYPKLGYVETGRRTDAGFERIFFSKRLETVERALEATE
jgi:ribosomal protein S18 acetylase RimI-like enzyme